MVAVPLADLGLSTGNAVHFYVELFQDRTSLDRVPSEGMIELVVPSEDFDARNWQV